MKKQTCILLMITVWISIGSRLLADNTAVSSAKKPKKIMLLDTELGSKFKPVKCNNARGETEYLKQLRDKKGNPVLCERIGHGGPTHEGHYLDKYAIKTGDGALSVEIYMDMYCPGHQETRPIKEFKIAAKKPDLKTKKKGQSRVNHGKKTVEKKDKKNKKTKKTKEKKQITHDTIPGFDDPPVAAPKQAAQKKSTQSQAPPTAPGKQVVQEEKIPGFDDVERPANTPADHDKKYVSLVPVLNPSKKPKKAGGFPTTINTASEEMLQELNKTLKSKLLIDEKRHTIRGSKEDIKKLYTISDGKKDQKKKMDEIRTQIMEPWKIDLIVAGRFRYEKNAKKYTVTPILISKPDNKILSSKHFVYGHKMKGDKIKQGFKNKMMDLVKAEFPSIFQPNQDNKKNPGNSKPKTTKANTGNSTNAVKSKNAAAPANPTVNKFYVSFIPFSDFSNPVNISSEEEKSLAELLNEAITEGVNQAKQNNNTLVINAPNHTIPVAEATAVKLNNILFKSQLSKTKIVKKIIDEIMTPNDIDYIFTTRYKEDDKNNIVIVLPHIISKPGKKMFPVTLIFTKSDLVCEDTDSKKKILCHAARDNIIKAVRVHLEQYVK